MVTGDGSWGIFDVNSQTRLEKFFTFIIVTEVKDFIYALEIVKWTYFWICTWFTITRRSYDKSS